MPAMALTDHGNMFGAIEFYNKAQGRRHQADHRHRGLRRPGQPTATATPSAGEQQPPGAAGARTRPATGTCSSSPPRSYLEGFYYKPRIDKELLRQHSEGLIGLSACLNGEINEQILAGREERGRGHARASSCDIFGEGNFYLELQDHGIPEQRARQRGAAPHGAQASASRWWPPTTATTSARTTPSPTTSCSASAPRRRSPTPTGCATPRDEFYLKTRDEMHSALPRRPRGDREHAAPSPSAATSTIPTGEFHLPEFPVPAGDTLAVLLRAGGARGPRASGSSELRRRRAQGLVERTRRRSTAQRLEYELEVIERMGFAGYFLIVWDFIRYAREHGIPVGPGPRLGRRLAGRLRAAHHRHRPAAVRPALRALPQPRAHQHARHRHRLLHARPRRGHPVRQREVRPRPGGADHHLRDAGRQGGDPRRRPRAGRCPTPRSTASPSWSPT